jgi:hypothetical protein
VNPPEPKLEDWDAVLLDRADDVATALKPIAAGAEIRIKAPDGMRRLGAVEAVPRFHKIALVALAAGAPVKKYGEVIGEAAAAIAAGQHVHTHNLVSRRAKR